MLASIIANVNRGKGQAPFTIEDFMPSIAGDDTRPQKDTTTERNAAILGMAAARMTKHG